MTAWGQVCPNSMEESATPTSEHTEGTPKTPKKRVKVGVVCDMCSDGGSWGYRTPSEGERVILALILGHVHRKLGSPDLQIYAKAVVRPWTARLVLRLMLGLLL